MVLRADAIVVHGPGGGHLHGRCRMRGCGLQPKGNNRQNAQQNQKPLHHGV